jgi:hypothetical protein
MNHFLADLSKITGGIPAAETFQKKYLTDFWTLIAYNE